MPQPSFGYLQAIVWFSNKKTTIKKNLWPWALGILREKKNVTSQKLSWAREFIVTEVNESGYLIQ